MAKFDINEGAFNRIEREMRTKPEDHFAYGFDAIGRDIPAEDLKSAAKWSEDQEIKKAKARERVQKQRTINNIF